MAPVILSGRESGLIGLTKAVLLFFASLMKMVCYRRKSNRLDQSRAAFRLNYENGMLPKNGITLFYSRRVSPTTGDGP
jgi:hypothetical protein